MTILDIDLDAFVLPVVTHERIPTERPKNDDHRLMPDSQVRQLFEDCQVTKETALLLLEEHIEILTAFERLHDQKLLTLPVHWVHIDAHDDFYGHFSKPSTSSNFMYEVCRRGWVSQITWAYWDKNT